MPLFRYEALDRTGNKVIGAMQVADEQTLTARLGSMGYRPTAIEVVQRRLRPESRRALATREAAEEPAAAGRVPGSRLSAGERAVARMLHQLYLSFRAGMPAYQALTTVQQQVREAPLRRVLGEMAYGVQEGNLLSSQMERYPRLFSRGDVGMIRAAEIGGFLPEGLESLATRHEQDDNTRRRLGVWAWFIHLNFVVLLGFIAVSFFFKAAIEAGFDAGAGFRAVGRALLTITLPGLLLYTAAVVGFHRGRRNPRLAYLWHRLLLRLPVAGKINHLRANAVFARALQQLYHAAVIPAAAWEAAAGAVPNLVLAERFARGMPVIEGTGKASLALQEVGLMDPADIGMVATGEATGEVEQALAYLAARYEEDVRVALGTSVVRGAVGFTLLAVLLSMLGEAFFFQGYYGNIIRLVMKAMGVEE